MVSLVVPGSSERKLEKARELRVSEVVIDLEDAVTRAQKAGALTRTLRVLEAGLAAGRVAVRVNPVGSPWCDRELDALASSACPPDSVVVPKAASPDQLVRVAERLQGIGVQALVETAAGIQRVDELAACSPHVEAVILGYADLAVSLGRSPIGAADLDLWLGLQDRILVAARAARVRAVDGPFLAVDDPPGLRQSAARAAQLGFDAKWVIHPSHIALVATQFIPSAETVARARAVVKALAQAAEGGEGATSLDGMMLDEAVRMAALRTLAAAEHMEP